MKPSTLESNQVVSGGLSLAANKRRSCAYNRLENENSKGKRISDQADNLSPGQPADLSKMRGLVSESESKWLFKDGGKRVVVD